MRIWGETARLQSLKVPPLFINIKWKKSWQYRNPAVTPLTKWSRLTSLVKRHMDITWYSDKIHWEGCATSVVFFLKNATSPWQVWLSWLEHRPINCKFPDWESDPWPTNLPWLWVQSWFGEHMRGDWVMFFSLPLPPFPSL